MNPSSDDTPIRELLQRLQRADEQVAPSFEQLLARPLPQPARPSRRVPWAVAACAAVALLAALLLLRSQQDDPRTAPQLAESGAVPAPAVVSDPQNDQIDIDFDYLRRSVEDYFSATQPSNPMDVWSSRTESLLTVNLSQLQQ